MLLYVMRHGVAVERGDPEFPDDARRPLTPDGRRKTRAAARGLRRLKPEIDLIYTSPLPRALQTAEIVAAELRLATAALRQTPALAPGAPRSDLFRELNGDGGNGVGAARGILVVGHEPDLSNLIAHLLTGDSRGLDLALKKSAIAALEVASLPPIERATLLWFLQPRQLRAIGRGA